MTYVAQLLPDIDQARVLRQSLADYVQSDQYSEGDKDLAWELLAKLTCDMNRAHRTQGK
jgi:hypothetical protein